MEGHGHVIGIDLGTTNSVVAVMEAGEPSVIQNTEGQPKTPSVVAFMPDGQTLVGEIARRQGVTQPRRTISSIKRLVGRLYQEILDDQEYYPFELSEKSDGRVLVHVEDRDYLPEEISALVLKKLKDSAEDYLGEPVSRAVVTVPAYFDDVQRQATLEAARQAGLEVLRLLNEPTAAAMAYGLGHDGQHTVAVYDFGGGTFDFSVMEIDNKTFEVLVTTGDSRLGGDDLDGVLMDHLAEEFEQLYGLDLRQDILALRRLKDAAERAKCELSTAFEAVISLPFIGYKDGLPLHLESSISRETLEELIEPLVKETIECCNNGLRQGKIRKNAITKVILVGGSTRIPLVQDSVEDFFGLPPFKGLNPDEIVAVGAATQGAVMNGELDEVVLLDVTPHCLGLEIKGNRKSVLIEKNSTIPIKVTKTFTTTEDNQSFVNIHALQGDSEKASECRSIGKFTLSGIETAEAGIPRIRVTFFINADGIVDVSASDTQSGAEKTLTINHAYLSVNERRTQQSADDRRRRRRRGSNGVGTTSDARRSRRTGGTSPADTGSGTPSRPDQTMLRREPLRVPAPAAQERDQGSDRGKNTTNRSRAMLSATFAEVKSETDNGRKAKAQEPPPPLPPPAETPGTIDDSTQNILRMAFGAPPAATPVPKPTPAWPAELAPWSKPTQVMPVRPPRAIQDDDTDPLSHQAPRAEESRSEPPEEGGPPIATPMPPDLEAVIEHLARSHSETATCQAYLAARDAFLRFCQENPADTNLQFLLAKFYIYTKQAEEARDVLDHLRVQRPERLAQVLEIYGQLCLAYPNYVAARRDRALLATTLGNYPTAMLDLEFVVKRDETNEEVLGQLGQLYETMLGQQPDATIQFKLVKLYLRRQDLDAAIGLLQQLVSIPDYRDRAGKVLGLCFWQKGMRYLAWQKFRSLPLDEEMKDIVYRLADDMEHHDELLHARYALERIYENNINYRDVGERLKKIRYRLELQRDERYGGGPQHNTPFLGEGNSEFSRRFEVIEEINRGSMGIVFKARDLTLDEIVAIKVLNDFLCQDPQAIERFKQEARSARKLTHNHIVRIHDMFDLDNKKIISMEYIEGENLKTIILRHGTMTEDVILNYLVQICEGLAYAHRLHLVHRDIKPANIMITDHNLLKITDFGIAKLLTEHQTKAGTVIMGTPLYMAPEQIEGGKIDNRCDIYSLGIMLYEMVTGEPPFSEGNIEYQHIHHAAPEIKFGISDRLRGIIMKCIEKKPENRFQAVEEILVRII